MVTTKSDASLDTLTSASGDPVEGSHADAGEDDVATFLSKLAHAMQVAVGAEHVRTSQMAEQRRQTHIQGLVARAASEADEFSEVADRDIEGIDAWAEAEIARLRGQREARIAARRIELQARLDEHQSRLDREVELINAAVSAHRADVDRFFEGLQAEVDPLAIALHAGARPRFPTLDSLSGDQKVGSAVFARVVGDAADGTPARMVGVMGPAPAEAQGEGSSSRLRAERLIGTLLGRDTKESDRPESKG